MNLPGADDAGRARRIKHSAWGLAALALVFYVGFIAWSMLRGWA
jgi:hypothetical protein